MFEDHQENVLLFERLGTVFGNILIRTRRARTRETIYQVINKALAHHMANQFEMLPRPCLTLKSYCTCV